MATGEDFKPFNNFSHYVLVKPKGNFKTKLSLQFCMNGLTIIIGHGHWSFRACLVDKRKRERKDVNKRISRLFVNEISIMVCYLVCLHPFFPSSYWSTKVVRF